MKTFFVYVDITFSTSVSVEAETAEEARRLAELKVDDAYQYYAKWGSYVGSEAYDCEEDHPNEE